MPIPSLRDDFIQSIIIYGVPLLFKLIVFWLIQRLFSESGARIFTDISIPRRLAFCAAMIPHCLQIAQRRMSILAFYADWRIAPNSLHACKWLFNLSVLVWLIDGQVEALKKCYQVILMCLSAKRWGDQGHVIENEIIKWMFYVLSQSYNLEVIHIFTPS